VGEVVTRGCTALQVDGIVALHVPKFVAVDFADVVVILLAIDVVLEINELLATEEVVGAAELLDMAAGWMYDWPEAPDGFLDPLVTTLPRCNDLKSFSLAF
jgi:hypothetical protein